MWCVCICGVFASAVFVCVMFVCVVCISVVLCEGFDALSMLPLPCTQPLMVVCVTGVV